METKPTLSQLLAKPIWQMTEEEFLQLNELGRENAAAGEESKDVIEYAHGITELSQKIGCCQSTIYMLKKEGVLDDAIVSQVGRKIIFNIGQARKTGMTPAAYCRRAAIRKQIAEALSEEDRKLLHSLWNIGNNLNQLVHNLHAFGRTAQERELRQMSREFSQVLAYFREVRDGR